MTTDSTTVGTYLAARLHEIGLGHYFAVPGDYNLVLLDELLTNQNLRMISCANELNAGYAADGYARATIAAAAIVVTFSVGGLSALNAIAGAYAENLPLVAISGGPNTNSEAECELLHHTLGVLDYGYQREIYSRVTADAVIIRNPVDAPYEIDTALDTALRTRKPVYIEVACNIAKSPTSAPHARSFDGHPASDPRSLADAVAHASDLLNRAAKPVLVAGDKLRPFAAVGSFRAVADAAGYAVATMPNAKGLFDEQHPGYLGTYWGPVGSPGCAEIIESADLALFAGPTFTDYTTAGHASLINSARVIEARPHTVITPGQTFNEVALADFLRELAPQLRRNDASLVAYRRIREEPASPPPAPPDSPLTTRQLINRIQQLLDSNSCVIAETGDSWFNAMRLALPTGAAFEIQMQYGSIGWSVGAALGYAIGAPDRRVVAIIGDGSFQMTAQELSTMIRYGLRPILFLINNGGYTIEVEIHDGPYNAVKNWDYAGLVQVFNAADGQGWSARVGTAGELDAAVQQAVDHNGPALIECVIDRDDCSKNLLEWGAHVARNNGRPLRAV